MSRRMASSTVSRSLGLVMEDFPDAAERCERSDILDEVRRLDSPLRRESLW
jgi:hypothetical protein